MKNNKLAELSDEKLIKKRDLLKGIAIGYGIFFLMVLCIFIYIYATNKSEKISIVTLIPVFTLPMCFLPLLISLGTFNKEIKTRKLK